MLAASWRGMGGNDLWPMDADSFELAALWMDECAADRMVVFRV